MAPTSSSKTWPSCSTRNDPAPVIHSRAVGSPGNRAASRRPRPDGVSAGAGQRSHRTARKPRRGRALRTPGHLPERPLRAASAPYAEAGYGNPESGQTVVNVTNGKIIRLLVDDEPFDVRYGDLRKHERVLDLRDGVLRRTAEWVSPTGRPVRISTIRLVSFYAAGDRGHLLRGRAARRRDAAGRPIRTRHQRADAAGRQTIHDGCGARSAAAVGSPRSLRAWRRARPLDEGQRLESWRPRWTTDRWP